MTADSLVSASAAIGSGFFGGVLLGYALKKAVKLIAVVIGLFIAGLVYLLWKMAFAEKNPEGIVRLWF